MAFFLSLVVSWSNPRLREKRLFFYLFKALGIYTKDFTLPRLIVELSAAFKKITAVVGDGTKYWTKRR